MEDPRPFSSTMTLLRTAKGGDRHALSHLLERYRPILTRRIRLMMGENARRCADTGDFLHGVFVEVLRRLDQFEARDERSFIAWATEIGRNAVRKQVGRRHERAFSSLVTTVFGGELATQSPGPSDRAALSEQRHRLAEAIEHLDPEHEEVVRLRHLEGLSFAAIGERMGRTENAAQLLHARALGRLSALVGR